MIFRDYVLGYRVIELDQYSHQAKSTNLPSLCRGWASPYRGMLKVPSQATVFAAGGASIQVISDTLASGASLM